MAGRGGLRSGSTRSKEDVEKEEKKRRTGNGILVDQARKDLKNQPLISESLKKTVQFKEVKERIEARGKVAGKFIDSRGKDKKEMTGGVSSKGDAKDRTADDDELARQAADWEKEWWRMCEEVKELKEMVMQGQEKKKEEDERREELEKKNVEYKVEIGRLGKIVEKMEGKLESVEKKMEELEGSVKDLNEVVLDILNEKCEGDNASESASVKSKYSAWSGRSGKSGMSVCSLSEKEVIRMKKLVNEKEREERRLNVVIKGCKGMSENVKVEVEKLLQDKIGVKVHFEAAWKSGQVVIGRCQNAEQKEEIMRGKAKLVGSTIFIDNDLTFEERKVQERINRWAREQRDKGKEVRVGLGKVCVNGKWIRWTSMQDERVESENF
ncbi:centrosomal protein of 120 kDa-like [Trichogramma pretiosum]|uniref:centrosomal protein of 120 kDa-like n=1 Tax=Trichogramma pretiosum TaxID=7493 RepID=UPI0006C9ACDE|nr:centrosomal protein of 120 kDa-like [Trichogramma pretiosum]